MREPKKFDLEAIETLLNKTTAGVWEYSGELPDMVGVYSKDMAQGTDEDFEGFKYRAAKTTMVCLTILNRNDDRYRMLTIEDKQEIRANTEFIANAHQDIPLLLAEVNRQHNEIIHLQVQLRQAQEALETAKNQGAAEEKEACLEIVDTMMDKVENYSNGSFSGEEHTNRAIHSHLRTIYTKIMAR